MWGKRMWGKWMWVRTIARSLFHRSRIQLHFGQSPSGTAAWNEMPIGMTVSERPPYGNVTLSS